MRGSSYERTKLRYDQVTRGASYKRTNVWEDQGMERPRKGKTKV